MTTQASLDQIQELYIAYYGRPADSAGLTYWANALDSNGGNLGSIINSFATSPESTTLYGAATTPTSIVTAIYENVLHRAPDAQGLAFYSSALSSDQISAGNLALAVVNGVQNADVATVQSEVNVANQFTAAATNYSGTTAADVGRTLLAQVTGDSATDAALVSTLTDYVNAASAATTTPSQFTGLISGGMLANPAVVGNYASGPTPTPVPTPTPAPTPTPTPAPTPAPTPTFALSYDSNSDLVGFSNASGTITLTSITTASGQTTVVATDTGGHTTSITEATIAGFNVTSGQTLSISDQLANGQTIIGAGNVSITDCGKLGLYDMTSIANTGTFTIPATGVTPNIEMTVAQVLETGANNSNYYAANLSVKDTLANIAPHDQLSLSTNGGFSQPPSGFQEVIWVGGVHGYTLSNAPGSLGSLSLGDAAVLQLASNAVQYTYSLSTPFGSLGAVTPYMAAAAYGASNYATNGSANYTYSLTGPSGSLGALTPTEAGAVVAASNWSTGGYSYIVQGTVAGIEGIEGSAALTDATSYGVVDTLANLAQASSVFLQNAQYYWVSSPNLNYTLSQLSVANADLIYGAVDLLAYTYKLSDTLVNIEGAVSGVVSYATSYSLTNATGSLGSLSVANAALAVGATNANQFTYSLSDTAADFFTTSNGTLTNTLTASAQAALQNADLASGSNVTVTGNATVAQIAAIQGIDQSGTISYTLSDTLAHLENAATGVVSHSGGGSAYNVVDTAANILADNSTNDPSGLLLHAATVEAIGTGVAQVTALQNLGTGSITGTLTYALSDSLSNLEGATTGVLQGSSGYTVVDSSTNILTDASDTASVLAGASAITMNVDGTTDTGTLTTTHGITLGITGSSNLSFSIATTAGADTVNASNYTGTLTLSDSGHGDTISTGSGATTITETGSTTDNIIFSAHATNVDTLILNAAGQQTDVVNGFVAGQDVIKLTGLTSLKVGPELGAGTAPGDPHGVITMAYNHSYNVATGSHGFIPAAQAVSTATAGDVVAWTDGTNTFVTVFEGTGPNQAHVVELVGIAPTHGIAVVGNGITIS